MSSEPDRYIVVIGDIVNSKKISGRFAFQSNLQTSMESAVHGGEIASPYTITLGDEFQAVFDHGVGVFRSLFYIRAAMYPVRCRFAVSIGAIATPVNPDRALGMDGPAFHNARTGIETMKKSKRQISLLGLSRPLNQIVKPSVRLLWETTLKWNTNRLQILVGLLDGVDEAEMARSLGISERAVYKNIREGGLKDWKNLIESTEARLTALL